MKAVPPCPERDFFAVELDRVAWQRSFGVRAAMHTAHQVMHNKAKLREDIRRSK